MLLPETGGDEAIVVTERLRQAIADQPMRLSDGRMLHVTASFGVAALAPSLTSVPAWLETADAMLYAAVQRPITEAALNEPATAAAWQAIPSWVVIGAEDKAIPPAGQRFMARRAHARVTEIPGAPHVSMLPFPRQVTAVIEAAAR